MPKPDIQQAMFISAIEREFTQAFGHFLLRNPFDDATAEQALRQVERLDLGLAAEEAARPPIAHERRPRVNLLVRRSEALLERLRERLLVGERPANHYEARCYQDLFLGSVYLRTFEGGETITAMTVGTSRVKAYRPFVELCRYWMEVPLEVDPFFHDPPHMFAICYQLRRAFELIGSLLQGNSRPIHRLRAAIWNSIVPHELRLYGNLLYNRMHEVTTLILGPVRNRQRTGRDGDRPLALCSLRQQERMFCRTDCHCLSPDQPLGPLSRSGGIRNVRSHGWRIHRRDERPGRLVREVRRGHTVFLDEIGELDERVQVKLLRVLQSREFHRVGETEPRRFEGRIIAATNRDLGTEIGAGRFAKTSITASAPTSSSRRPCGSSSTTPRTTCRFSCG